MGDTGTAEDVNQQRELKSDVQTPYATWQREI